MLSVVSGPLFTSFPSYQPGGGFVVLRQGYLNSLLFLPQKCHSFQKCPTFPNEYKREPRDCIYIIIITAERQRPDLAHGDIYWMVSPSLQLTGQQLFVDKVW